MNPYLAPARIQAALRTLGLHPTRGMGQNFLIDPQVLEQIVAAGEPGPQDVVLEVGPGLGVLTWELVRRAARVVSVELDKRLAARLAEEFVNEPHLTIVQGDILRLPPHQLLKMNDEPASLTADRSSFIPQPYKVIANLPYAITSPVLRHFLEADWKPQLLVVLVQWEVAQRIIAAPTTGTAGHRYSVLAHSVQIYAAAEIVGRIPPTSFLPQPAVHSAILQLRLYDRPAVAVDDIDALFRVIKAGFLQPRKKLANALPGGLAAMGRPDQRAAAATAPQQAGIDSDRRAETLTLDEWARLYTELQQH